MQLLLLVFLGDGQPASVGVIQGVKKIGLYGESGWSLYNLRTSQSASQPACENESVYIICHENEPFQTKLVLIFYITTGTS
jgi:hypothetical protein